VPITGNGSVTDARTAAEMAKTGVSAIMVGRAALSNPFVFASLKNPSALPAPCSRFPVLFRTHLAYLLSFRDQLAACFPDDHVPSPDAFASVKMHVHLFRYFNGRPGAAALRAKLNTVRTLREIEESVSSYS